MIRMVAWTYTVCCSNHPITKVKIFTLNSINNKRRFKELLAPVLNAGVNVDTYIWGLKQRFIKSHHAVRTFRYVAFDHIVAKSLWLEMLSLQRSQDSQRRQRHGAPSGKSLMATIQRTESTQAHGHSLISMTR